MKDVCRITKQSRHSRIRPRTGHRDDRSLLRVTDLRLILLLVVLEVDKKRRRDQYTEALTVGELMQFWTFLDRAGLLDEQLRVGLRRAGGGEGPTEGFFCGLRLIRSSEWAR